MTTAQIRGNRPARLTAIPSQARSAVPADLEGVEARRAASNGRDDGGMPVVAAYDEGMVQRTNVTAIRGSTGTKVLVR